MSSDLLHDEHSSRAAVEPAASTEGAPAGALPVDYDYDRAALELGLLRRAGAVSTGRVEPPSGAGGLLRPEAEAVRRGGERPNHWTVELVRDALDNADSDAVAAALTALDTAFEEGDNLDEHVVALVCAVLSIPPAASRGSSGYTRGAPEASVDADGRSNPAGRGGSLPAPGSRSPTEAPVCSSCAVDAERLYGAVVWGLRAERECVVCGAVARVAVQPEHARRLGRNRAQPDLFGQRGAR